MKPSAHIPRVSPACVAVDAENLGLSHTSANGPSPQVGRHVPLWPGVLQDDSKGVFWYRKAAELGNAGAANNLAVCYEKGLGFPRTTLKQPSGYRKVAEQGDESTKAALPHCGW